MSGKPVSQTLRKMKHDKNITPEEARERKEIRAEPTNENFNGEWEVVKSGGRPIRIMDKDDEKEVAQISHSRMTTKDTYRDFDKRMELGNEIVDSHNEKLRAETNKKPKIIVMQDQHDGDIMGVVGIPSGADVAAIKAASEPYSVMSIANMVKLGAINYNDYEEWYY